MENVEKIVYIREYSESAGMFLNRYVSEVTIVNNDIISYMLSSSKPYVFNNNDLVEKMVTILRSECINNKIRYYNIDTNLYISKDTINNIHTANYNKRINYNDLTLIEYT